MHMVFVELKNGRCGNLPLSRLVTFASASYGFPPEMTKQRNFDVVPFSKPGAHWLGCYAFIVASSSFAFQLR